MNSEAVGAGDEEECGQQVAPLGEPGTEKGEGHDYGLTPVIGGALWLTRAYNDAGQLLGESYSGGPLSGLSVTNQYDALLRRTNVALVSGTTRLTTNGWSYEAGGGRLQTVSLPGHSVTYSYVANSPLVEQLVFKQGTTTRMTTTKSHDLLNRLTNTVSSAGGSNAVSFAYAYNAANQRTSVTNVDGSYWVYSYDALGQVTSGKKRWSDGTLVAGQQFEYGFDDIGNRDWTKAGQEVSSGQSNRADYANNPRNQITQREVAGFLGVSGVADEEATVTVNLTATARKGGYWWGEAPAANSGGPVWLAVTNIAVLDQGASPDRVATNIGHAFVPGTPEVFGYDADGNLTSDSLWTNTWNAENRRVAVESRTAIPAAVRMKEQWTHLPDGRWIERIVSTNSGSAYVPAFTNRYVWDGNVVLAVLNGTNGLELAFLRGLDLSGSVDGAGGVGGLLAVQVGAAGPASLANTVHFAAYDGNGNVAALVSGADGSVTAQYEYGPFGELVRATGPMAKVNPMRFSTQYADDVTGDVKYKHRNLDIDQGRFASRDPIGERGGLNLYGFVGNEAISGHDILGLRGEAALLSKLFRHHLYGGGTDLVLTDPVSVDAILDNGTPQALERLLDRAFQIACAKGKRGQSQGFVETVTHTFSVTGHGLTAFLNQGHLRLNGHWEMRRGCLVCLKDIENEFWDEIVLKTPSRKEYLPDGWQLYPGDDTIQQLEILIPGPIFYTLGLWQEYMLSVEWSSPEVCRSCR